MGICVIIFSGKLKPWSVCASNGNLDLQNALTMCTSLFVMVPASSAGGTLYGIWTPLFLANLVRKGWRSLVIIPQTCARALFCTLGALVSTIPNCNVKNLWYQNSYNYAIVVAVQTRSSKCTKKSNDQLETSVLFSHQVGW